MSFTQNDLIWFLLQPSSLIFWLLVLGFVFLLLRWNALGRGLIGLTLVLATLPALFPIMEMLAKPLEDHFGQPNPLPNTIDGILVLGGSVDWPISQSRGIMNLNKAGERMFAVSTLAEHYPTAKLVFTGLFEEVIPNELSMAAQSKTFLSGPEFQNRSVTFIGAARSTYEEALLSIQTVQPQTGERWLLVTSAYHMPRAIGVFKTQGWTLIPYPVDYQSTGKLEFKPTFNVFGGLVDLDDLAREWGALFIYKRLGRIEKMFP
jgi:uncharacterized SAM-binding protein YcdF (DUF218 family)